MTFSERYNTRGVMAVKILQKNFNRFVTTSENVKAGVKKNAVISMFFGRCDLVFKLFKKRRCIFDHMQEDTPVLNLV